MGKYKAIYVIALVIVLLCFLLVSCDNDEEKSNVVYKENIINLPKDITYISDFIIKDDGTIKLAGTQNKTKCGSIWETTDRGKTWKELYRYTDIIGVDSDSNCECFAYISENTNESICILCNYKEDGSFDYIGQCFVIGEDGNCNEIINNFPETSMSNEISNEFSYVSHIIDEKTILMGNESGEMYIVDKENGKIKRSVLNSGDVLLGQDSFIYKDGILYAISTKGNKCYDLNDMEEEKLNEMANKGFDNLSKEYINSETTAKIDFENDAFYIANEKGIQQYDENGSEELVTEDNSSVD